MSTSENYPNLHSIRLRGYDYAQKGLYFITLCTYKRKWLFGQVINGEMRLSPAGEIAYNTWLETIRIRPNVILGDFIVMPNHFHAVFAIEEAITGKEYTGSFPPAAQQSAESHKTSRLHSPSQTVGAIVRGYKSKVSNRIGNSIWQRNYYEHIIRDEQSLLRISQYIVSNPSHWRKDCFSAEESR